jgi:uncharacterized protein YjeT (DUF2065 family)
VDWQDLFGALAIVCVIEGVMPFVNPAGMRRLLTRLCELNDRELRLGGFFSMLVGLVILYMVRN